MAAVKYNYKKLTNDLRGGDLDIAIFALRTIIKINRGQLGSEDIAIPALTEVISQLLPSWPEEVAFYGQRALEHLKSLEREEIDDDEPLDEAPIEMDRLDSDDRRMILDTLKKIEVQKHTAARDKILKMIEASNEDFLLLATLLSTLGQIGTSSDLFVVKKFTSHTNDRVRSACVLVIDALADDPQIVKAMAEPFLKDRGGLPRASAVKVIGAIDFSAVEDAINQSIDAGSVADRAAMAEALCLLDCDEAVPFIRKLSEDSEQTVRMKVLETLEKGDHPQKSFILKRMVKDSSPVVAKVAKEALKRYETHRMLSIGGFKNMLPENLPAAKKMRNLEEMQASEELDPIELDDLKDPDSSLKLLCLRRIRQRTYQKAYDGVVDLLGIAENVEILSATISCLTVIGSGADVQSLQHFVVHSSDAVRAATVEAVDQLASTQQSVFLVLPMVFDSSPVVRLAAGKAMKRLEEKDILVNLSKMVQHKSTGIKSRLVQFLSNFSGDRVMKVFFNYLKTQDASFRLAIAKALFEQKDERAATMLSALSKDSVKQIRVEATRLIAVKARPDYEANQGDLPPLSDLLSVIDDIIVQAQEEIDSIALKESEYQKQVLASKPADGVVKKLAIDVSSRKELDMLKLNRKVILADMGRKVYRLILRKDVSHRDYDKTVYLIKKFKHQEETAPKKAAKGTGFWDRVQAAAGIEKKNGEVKKIKEKLNAQYTELGRIAFHLSYTQNEIYQDLHMEYIELESVENKITEKKEQLGIK